MSAIGITGVALSAVLLVLALLTASVPLAYTALAGIAFICVDAYRSITHPQETGV